MSNKWNFGNLALGDTEDGNKARYHFTKAYLRYFNNVRIRVVNSKWVILWVTLDFYLIRNLFRWTLIILKLLKNEKPESQERAGGDNVESPIGWRPFTSFGVLEDWMRGQLKYSPILQVIWCYLSFWKLHELKILYKQPTFVAMWSINEQ